MDNIGKLIVSVGVILVIIGLGLSLFGDKLGWLGNLPGFTFYFSIATMILISFILSTVMWLIDIIIKLVR
jgi:Protein of unknown function (DUF2905)